MSSIRILCLTGSSILPYIDALAELRIRVFREFPYLYDGSFAYEQKYLKRYTSSDKTVVVLALDGDKVVGASTGMPMSDEDPMVWKPFESARLNPKNYFYFGESVLLQAYRGQGIGVRFFQEREAHALRLGYTRTTFCAVDRPVDHPRKPADYQPLHAFWKKRGYEIHPELKATFKWQDLDEDSESDKLLTFWIKEHTG
jgi:GNAT superfamily N-acetyltransferase